LRIGQNEFPMMGLPGLTAFFGKIVGRADRRMIMKPLAQPASWEIFRPSQP
jgi:hypothetical protein